MSEEGCGCRKPPGKHESFCLVPYQEKVERLENRLTTKREEKDELDARLVESQRSRQAYIDELRQTNQKNAALAVQVEELKEVKKREAARRKEAGGEGEVKP